MTQEGRTQKKESLVLGYDLGGTKVALAVVNSRGKILEETRQRVVVSKGKKAVLEQLAVLGKGFLQRYPKIKKVGVASAGPLDPKRGLLLDPTNLMTRGKSWGIVPICATLKKQLRREVILENDAAAAILAEHWVGRARNVQNAMILTLGTGVGTGIICNGKLLRSGRGLHPEGGHLMINYDDPSAPSGVGNPGTIEGYLSGNGFERRFFKKTGQKKKAKEIVELARKKNRKALHAFREYSHIMAVAIHNYVVLFSPEKVILTGSFAAASRYFVPETKKHLRHLLRRKRVGVDLLPKIEVSSLHNQAGVLGGAYTALIHLETSARRRA